MNGQGTRVNVSTLRSFCNCARFLNRKGQWGVDTTDMEGIYVRHFELLEMIDFPWE